MKRHYVFGVWSTADFCQLARAIAVTLGVDGRAWCDNDGNVHIVATHRNAAKLNDFLVQLMNMPEGVECIVNEAAPDAQISPGFALGGQI